MFKRILTACLVMLPAFAAFAAQTQDINAAFSGQTTEPLTDLFSPVPLDLSMQYLRMIFGTVGNVLIGQGDDLIAQLFGIFNSGLLVFVGGFVSYTVFRSVINTSQDGGMAGGQGKGGNAWTVFRIVLGVSLLVPMYQGYSMAQVTVMWSVKQGVGLADTMWTFTSNYLSEKRGAMIQPPQSKLYEDLSTISINGPEGKGQMKDLMKSAACLAVLDKSGHELIQKSQANNEGIVSTTAFSPSIRVGTECGPGSSNQTLCFGTVKAPKVCGSYEWSHLDASIQDSVKTSLLGASENYFYLMKNLYDQSTQFFDAQFKNGRIQFKKAFEDTNLIQSFTCSKNLDPSVADTCLPSVALVSGATHYYSAIKAARMNPDQNSNTEDQKKAWAAEAQKRGWITAGQSYYQMVSSQNTAPNELKPIDSFLFKQSSSSEAIPKISRPGNCASSGLDSKRTYQIGEQPQLNTQGGVYTLNQKSNFAACVMYDQISQVYNNHVRTKISQLRQSSLFGQLEQNQNENQVAKGTALDNVNQITAQALHMLINQNTMVDNFAKSAFRSDSGSPKADQSFVFSYFKGEKLDIAVYNIQRMIVLVMSDLMGIKPFDKTSLSQLYDNGPNFDRDSVTNSSECSGVMSFCPLTGNFDQCFSQAVEKKCIQTGKGILGSMASARDGQPVDQVLLVTSIGRSMLNNGVQYLSTTISGIYALTKQLTEDITHWMATAGLASSVVAFGAEVAAKSAGFGLGVLMSAGVGALQGAAQLGSTLGSMFYKFNVTTLGIYLPFGAALATTFIGMGITMGLYLPLIPFLTFLFSAIGWLIAVIEAMIAAPLVALGVTHPEGHDLLGKAEQSLMLLLGIFVRPASMLLGFIMAITLSYVAMEMLNVGFISMMISYLTTDLGSNAATVKLIGFCGVLLVYTYVAVAVIQQAFSMIYLVPQQLLRWIGVQESPSNVGQMMQEVRGGTKESAGQAAQGASQAAGNPPQMGPPQQMPTAKGTPIKDKEEEKAAVTNEENPDQGGADTSGGSGT